MTVSRDDLSPARSYLYTPADRPEMFPKAMGSGADAVILDLEDGVAPDAKARGREYVRSFLQSHTPQSSVQVWVRIDPRALEADLDVIECAPPPTGVVVAKATREVLELIETRLRGTVPLLPLVETARDLADVDSLAAGPGVHRLGIGEADLAAELGLSIARDDGSAWPHRFAVVLASAVAGIHAPVGPTATGIRDDGSWSLSMRGLRAVGFRGRTAVHPAQIATINEILTPTESEVERAREIVESLASAVANGHGTTVTMEGLLVDEAIARQARELLADREARDNY